MNYLLVYSLKIKYSFLFSHTVSKLQMNMGCRIGTAYNAPGPLCPNLLVVHLPHMEVLQQLDKTITNSIILVH